MDGDTHHWVKVHGLEASFGRRGKIIRIWAFWSRRSEDEERPQRIIDLGDTRWMGHAHYAPSHILLTPLPLGPSTKCSKWGHHQLIEYTCIWVIMPDPPAWLPPHCHVKWQHIVDSGSSQPFQTWMKWLTSSWVLAF